MKQKFFSLSLLMVGMLMISLANRSTPPREQPDICGPSAAERIRRYFDDKEIRPTQVINNTADLGRWTPKTSTIKIGTHTIRWTDKLVKLHGEATVRIDGELIVLKNLRSLNNANGNLPIDFRAVDQWDQIKLYKISGGDAIGITMHPRICTGLMCGVAAQLMYNVKKKQTTYFGTFRTDDETRLFRITNLNDYYYVSSNYDGDPGGLTTPQVVTYELYKLQPNGKFVVQSNPAGERYFIKHTTFPDMEFDGVITVQKKEIMADTLETNWINKID